MLRICIFLLALSTSFNLSAQNELPRRGFLGLAFGNEEGVQGIRIDRVIAGSTAAKAGVVQGDRLLALNGSPTKTIGDAIAFGRKNASGTPTTFTLNRDGGKIDLKASLAPVPYEKHAELNVTYSHVVANGSRLRSIVTKPVHGDKFPAILYIQGIGCSSLDNPMDSSNTQTQLIQNLAKSGYLVMRIDKSGTGDSEGKPCMNISFQEEAEGYRAALRNLSQMTDVDTKNIFLLGHSMGGVFAPLISNEVKTNGIIVYGTIGQSFHGYLVESRKTVAEALGSTPEDAANYASRCAKCLEKAKQVDYDIARAIDDPACAEFGDLLRTRDKTFLQQLFQLDVAKLWNGYNGRVLSLWGKSDFISLEKDHELIASSMNQRLEGSAQFLAVPDSDHGMATAFTASQAASNPGGYNAEIHKLILRWLRNEPLDAAPQTQTIEFPKDPTVKEVLRMNDVENAYPRWCSGGKIVFQSNRDGNWQVYIMNGDGSGQRNLSKNKFNDNFVAVSADGKHIAFVSDRDGNEEIYIMGDDGTSAKRLTNNPARDIHPYFTPDGNKIIFNSTRDGKEDFEVYSMDLSGANQTRLTNTPDEETCARVSPDGKRMVMLVGVAALYNDEILVTDQLAQKPQNLTRSEAAEGWPVWTPDGSKIYFASTRVGNTFCIFRMDADGKNVEQVTKVPAPFMDARPEISPDGKRLLFNRQVTGRSGKNTIAIYVKDL